MTFELLVWREDMPITRERAASTRLDEVAPFPGVAAFATGFAHIRPEVELSVDGERYARIRMAPEKADEISAEVYALARAHELVCYDPGRDLVLNLEPTGAYRDVQLHTGDGMVVVDPDLRLVRDVLDRLSQENPFAALVVFGRHFVQVSPEPGGYELEYKDGVQNRLYRTHVADPADVRRAFEEYLTDDRSFLDRHSWESPS